MPRSVVSPARAIRGAGCLTFLSDCKIRSVFKISNLFLRPKPCHIEIRHRVRKTSTINLFGFETLKLKIRRLKLWKPTVTVR